MNANRKRALTVSLFCAAFFAFTLPFLIRAVLLGFGIVGPNRSFWGSCVEAVQGQPWPFVLAAVFCVFFFWGTVFAIYISWRNVRRQMRSTN